MRKQAGARQAPKPTKNSWVSTFNLPYEIICNLKRRQSIKKNSLEAKNAKVENITHHKTARGVEEIILKGNKSPRSKSVTINIVPETHKNRLESSRDFANSVVEHIIDTVIDSAIESEKGDNVKVTDHKQNDD